MPSLKSTVRFLGGLAMLRLASAAPKPGDGKLDAINPDVFNFWQSDVDHPWGWTKEKVPEKQPSGPTWWHRIPPAQEQSFGPAWPSKLWWDTAKEAVEQHKPWPPTQTQTATPKTTNQPTQPGQKSTQNNQNGQNGQNGQKSGQQSQHEPQSVQNRRSAQGHRARKLLPLSKRGGREINCGSRYINRYQDDDFQRIATCLRVLVEAEKEYPKKLVANHAPAMALCQLSYNPAANEPPRPMAMTMGTDLALASFKETAQAVQDLMTQCSPDGRKFSGWAVLYDDNGWRFEVHVGAF